MPNEVIQANFVREPSNGTRNLLRRLPHNVDAEMALLGAIMMNNRAYERVADFLTAQHFILKEHATIYDAIARRIESGKIADPVTLKDTFESDDNIMRVGGIEYLARLMDCAATPINAGEYGRTVYDLFLRRELIALGEEIVNTAYDSEVEETAAKQVEKAESKLYEMAEQRDFSGFVSADEIAPNVFDASREALRRRREGRQNGIKTGLIDLDKIIGGMRGGQLIYLAGRPSMGKTTVATNITMNVARDFSYRRRSDNNGKIEVLSGGRPVFVSFETDKEALINQNFQVLITGIPGTTLLNPDPSKISEADIYAAAKKTRDVLAKNKIAIMDRVTTVAGIRTACRRWKRKHGADLLIIDYLGLIEAVGKRPNMNEHITEVSRSLKIMAKELDIPVIVLAQLNRECEKRDNKRPILADLRESGSLEQDADKVIFVYREHYYLTKNPPSDDTSQDKWQSWQRRCEQTAHTMELIVAKNRFGPTGTAVVHYNAEQALVTNAAHERQ